MGLDWDPEGPDVPEKQDNKQVAKKEGRGGHIASAVGTAVALGLVSMVPGLHLPFVLPVFASTLLVYWQVHLAATCVGSIMRAGYDAPVTRSFAKVAEHGTGAAAFYLTWKDFPLDFAAIGLPGFVGTVMRWIFLGAAVISGIKAFGHGLKLLFGKKTSKND